MTFTQIAPDFSVSPQLTEVDLRQAAAQGFRSIISNRPHGEEEGQPSAEAIRQQAEALGLAFAHLPVVPGAISEADGVAMAAALARLPGPVLGFCRSGARSTKMWELAQASRAAPDR